MVRASVHISAHHCLRVRNIRESEVDNMSSFVGWNPSLPNIINTAIRGPVDYLSTSPGGSNSRFKEIVMNIEISSYHTLLSGE